MEKCCVIIFYGVDVFAQVMYKRDEANSKMKNLYQGLQYSEWG